MNNVRRDGTVSSTPLHIPTPAQDNPFADAEKFEALRASILDNEVEGGGLSLNLWFEDDSASFEDLHNLGARLSTEFPSISFEVGER